MQWVYVIIKLNNKMNLNVLYDNKSYKTSRQVKR